MRIGIDARFYGIGHTGIGRYVQNLCTYLGKIDESNTYLIFGPHEIKKDIQDFPNFVYIPLNTKVYSLAEQVINPIIFSSYHLDLLHVPHFNIPLLYQGKIVVTIHDLIKHLSVGTKTSTHNFFIYHLKHIVYKIVVASAILRATKIITPTNYWKDYLLSHYPRKTDDIVVTYEGVASNLLSISKISPSEIVSKYGLEKPFVIYTGNLYPHKNVELAIQAVKKFNQIHNHQVQLALVCARSIFKERFQPTSYLKVLGLVPDEELSLLYQEALALVQPSFIEGFGLIGLEAMAKSLPVLSSNSSCLPEVYGEAALYFDPTQVDQLVNSLHAILISKDLRDSLILKGLKRVKLFSWSKMAKQTLAVYTAN